MKKNQKIEVIINALAEYSRFFVYEFEKIYSEKTGREVFTYDEEDMGISQLPNNEWEQISGFITLYDKDMQHISGNHIHNEKITYFNHKCKSGTIARVEEKCYFSLCHYLYGKEENAHKIRYVEIYLQGRKPIKWKISIDIFKGKIIVE